jgi:hypothetical protein
LLDLVAAPNPRYLKQKSVSSTIWTLLNKHKQIYMKIVINGDAVILDPSFIATEITEKISVLPGSARSPARCAKMWR